MASYWRIAYPGGIGYTNNEDIYNEAERYKYSTGARGAWVSELGEANEEKFKETDGGCVNINDGKWVTKGLLGKLEEQRKEIERHELEA